MNYRMPGFKALALSLLAAFVVAGLTATAAYAEGDFTIGGKTFPELKITNETAEATTEAAAAGLLLEGLDREITCKKREIDDILILEKGLMHGLLLWTECTTLEDKVLKGGAVDLNEVPECPVAPFSTSFLNKVRLLEGGTYLLFTPTGGESFGTITIEGEECPLAAEYPLKGSYATTIGPEAVTQSLNTVDKATAAALGAKLTMGAFTVTPTDKLLMTLNGANKGKKWGAV